MAITITTIYWKLFVYRSDSKNDLRAKFKPQFQEYILLTTLIIHFELEQLFLQFRNICISTTNLNFPNLGKVVEEKTGEYCFENLYQSYFQSNENVSIHWLKLNIIVNRYTLKLNLQIYAYEKWVILY